MVEARQLTACILGDGEGIRSSLEQTLQQLPEWSCTITGEQTASAAEPADVVFLILSSSAADDPTISLLNASPAIGDTPIVAVLATEDEYLAANTLAAGAADFLCTENLTISVLRHAIARVVSPSRQQPDASDPKVHEKLASSHATLERWAAELEIANARLREVDDLKTKFLSEVSHEIRTPLAAIVSAAKIITKHHQSKPEVVDQFKIYYKSFLSETIKHIEAGDSLEKTKKEFNLPQYRHYNGYDQLLELNIERAYANLKETVLSR